MAAHSDAIMPAAQLKPLLLASKHEPVSCAIGLTKEKHGVILLHRRMAPRQMLGAAKKAASEAGIELDMTSMRFGKAEVDTAADGALVQFRVNKPGVSAMHAKVLEQLKKAGFSKCDISVDAALDSDEAEGGLAGGHTGAPQHQGPASQPGAPSTPPAPRLHSLVTDSANALRDMQALDAEIAAGKGDSPQVKPHVDMVYARLKELQRSGREAVKELAAKGEEMEQARLDSDIVRNFNTNVGFASDYLTKMNDCMHPGRLQLAKAYAAFLAYEKWQGGAIDCVPDAEGVRDMYLGACMEGAKQVRDKALDLCNTVSAVINPGLGALTAVVTAAVKWESNAAASESQNAREALGETAINVLFALIGSKVSESLSAKAEVYLAKYSGPIALKIMASPMRAQFEEVIKTLPKGLGAEGKVAAVQAFVEKLDLQKEFAKSLGDIGKDACKAPFYAILEIYKDPKDFMPPKLQQKIHQMETSLSKGEWLRQETVDHAFGKVLAAKAA